jgi:Na+:H+ antiporter, NhaA family
MAEPNDLDPPHNVAQVVGDHPPGSWWRARGIARRALAPVERFLAVEASSGILLLGATLIALAWANSPWNASYLGLWQTPIGLKLGSLSFERDLQFWINDGLMTVFFFVVGLEIRREIHRGALSEVRRAALPLAAAVGGMLVPAGILLALNQGQPAAQGWGVPMATDIAFAVGVLALLGQRVPASLRILLLALAVIDDVGAILVIALFYSSGVDVRGLPILFAGVTAILTLQMLGVRSPWAYVLPAAVVWAGTYAAGIHPTLAGVAVGLMTPVHAWFGPQGFVERAGMSLSALRQDNGDNERQTLLHLGDLERAGREAVSPVERIQHGLHGLVAFGIMPLFALANAGVPLAGVAIEGQSLLVFLGVSIGLLLGKPLGILGLSWLSVRLGLASLPKGVGWPQLGLVGLVGGIGFTMALFIAHLAFPEGSLLESAKLAILGASGVAAIAGCVLGRLLLSPLPRSAAAPAPSAEGSPVA